MTPTDLSKLSPTQFEELCIHFLRASGWHNIEHHGAAGTDGGRDIIAQQHHEVVGNVELTIRWIVQCKRVATFTKSRLADAIAKVANYSADHFMLITSATLSSHTRDALEGLKNRYHLGAVVTIDGPEFCRTINRDFPHLAVQFGKGTDETAMAELFRRRVIARLKVIDAEADPSVLRWVDKYVRLGWLVKTELKGDPVFMSPEDAAFELLTRGVCASDITDVLCGSLDRPRAAAAVSSAAKYVARVARTEVVSLDWTDTLVDELHLDEHICECIAIRDIAEDEVENRRMRFHRIVTTLYDRADPRWYDYGYLAGLMGKRIDDVLEYHDDCDSSWGLMPGAEGFLAHLRALKETRGLVLALITHCHRDILDKRANLLGVDLGVFDFVLTGDDVRDISDKEELIGILKTSTGVSAEHILHVGDNVKRDVIPAARLGCMAILFRQLLRKERSFWTSSSPPFSEPLLELRQVDPPETVGVVSSYGQLTALLQ